jgi:hypothetical protein
MAIGDQAGLQAVQAAVAQLPGIEKFTDDERASLVAGMGALVAQAGSAVQADLKPLVGQLEAFNATAAALAVLLAELAARGVRVTLSVGGTYADVTLAPPKS